MTFNSGVISFWCYFRSSKKRECPAVGIKVCATAVEILRYVSSILETHKPERKIIESCYPPGCCATFCFWCLNYKTAENLGKSGVLYTLLACIAPCVPILLLRQEARERYNIEGDTCNDVITSLCCGECVMCQVCLQRWLNFQRPDFIKTPITVRTRYLIKPYEGFCKYY